LLGDSTQKGEGCVYVRYETLDKLDIDADKIISAKWVFRNISDLKNEVKISAYAVTEDWCSINTRWFNQPLHDETPLDIAKLSKCGDYEIDITPLLKEMIKNRGEENPKYSVRKSFMVKCYTSDSRVLLSSSNSGLFSPLLEITLTK